MEFDLARTRGNGHPSTMYSRSVSFTQSIELFFKNYVNFSGRSSKSAFWWWFLANILFSILAAMADRVTFDTVTVDQGPISTVWSFVTLIPGIALGARRLHDINKSGWWQLIAFTIIGIIPLIIWFVRSGDPHENDYGDDIEAGT